MNSELPFPLMLLLFLVGFLLMGVAPALPKLMERIREYLREASGAPPMPGSGAVGELEEMQEAAAEGPTLSEFESFVMRYIAQGSRKGVKLKEISAYLHSDPAVGEKTLESLHGKGLVRCSAGLLGGARCGLSRKGKAVAEARGYMPILRR